VTTFLQKHPKTLLVAIATLSVVLLWQLGLAITSLQAGRMGAWSGLAVAVVTMVIPVGLWLGKRWAMLFALLAAAVLLFDGLLAFTELNHYREKIGFDSRVAAAGVLAVKVMLCAICLISLTTPSARGAFRHTH
jgi:uncharacterized membrane protein (DUF2068 family)